jgi:hypothetical protein
MENKIVAIDVLGRTVTEIQALINEAISTNNSNNFILLSQNSVVSSTTEMIILSFIKFIYPTIPTP